MSMENFTTDAQIQNLLMSVNNVIEGMNTVKSALANTGRLTATNNGKMAESTEVKATIANLVEAFDHISVNTGNPHVVTKEDLSLDTDDVPEFAGLIVNGNTVLDGILQHEGSTAGLYSAPPVVQAAHIADADGTVGGNQTAINAILVALENLGVVASS